MTGLIIPVPRAQDIGPALRLIRTDLGIAQKVVARSAGLTASYLAQTELSRHRHSPNIALVVNVLDVLGHQIVLVPADQVVNVIGVGHGA